MFKREHHLRIATVLQSLDGDVLKAHGCLFGGGTAIVLTRGEYRESIDIDFLIADKIGFKDLRQALTGAQGISAIVRKGAKLVLSRDMRADQYGIRTMISAGDVEIKFEIVFEGRIEFQPPGSEDQVCGVSTLSLLDLAASKLLANSDRWSDDSVYSRDLIDLAMLGMSSQVRKEAIAKAKSAYGESVTRDLEKAIEKLKKRPGRLNECMVSLKMESIPEAVLWEKIRSLI